MRIDYQYLEDELNWPKGLLLKRILENQKLTGELKNIDSMVRIKSKLPDFKYMEDDFFKEQIILITESLNSKFDNNWSYHLEPRFDSSKYYYRLSVTILYPEVTITNQSEKTHLIKDLIVHFNLINNDNNISVHDLRGCRATISREEQDSRYRHSHLNSESFSNNNMLFYTRSFCLGVDTAMNNMIVDFQEENYEFSQDVFESFLYLIDSVIEWESAEGVPYIYIDDIRLKNGTPIPVYLSDVYYCYNSCDIGRFIDELGIKVNYRLLNGKYSIKKDAIFSESVKNILLRDDVPLKQYIIDKDMTNGYLSIDLSNADGEIEARDNYYIIIGEQKLIFTIETKDGELDSESIIRNAIIYPKFLNYVKREIEKKLYRKAIRKRIIERSSENSNA